MALIARDETGKRHDLVVALPRQRHLSTLRNSTHQQSISNEAVVTHRARVGHNHAIPWPIVQPWDLYVLEHITLKQWPFARHRIASIAIEIIGVRRRVEGEHLSSIVSVESKAGHLRLSLLRARAGGPSASLDAS